MTSCRLRAVLQCLGVSKAELSRQSGVSERDINRMIQYGVTDEHSGNHVAAALSVSLRYLEGEYDPISDKYVIGMGIRRMIESLHKYDRKNPKVRKEPDHVKS